MKKRVFSIFLALVMVLCLVPTVAMAEGNTGTTTVNLSVPEATYELVIPSKLDVTNSGYNAFENGVTVKNLTNAGGISSIDVSATSANSWNLTNSNKNKISYQLVSSDAQYKSKTLYSFTDKTSMATVDGQTFACGVNVSDYSAAAAGEYSDTITWTANIVRSGVVVNGDGTKTVTLTKGIMGSNSAIGEGQSVTSDGVTILVNHGTLTTQYENSGWLWVATYDNEGNDFTISTTEGNFTKIEIVGEIVVLSNTAWTQESNKIVWTGSSPSVNVGRYFENVTAVICTIAPTIAPTED